MTCSAASAVNGRMGSSFLILFLFPHEPARILRNTVSKTSNFFNYISILDNVKKSTLF